MTSSPIISRLRRVNIKEVMMLDTCTVRGSIKKFTLLMENPQIIGNKGFIEERQKKIDSRSRSGSLIIFHVTTFRQGYVCAPDVVDKQRRGGPNVLDDFMIYRVFLYNSLCTFVML